MLISTLHIAGKVQIADGEMCLQAGNLLQPIWLGPSRQRVTGQVAVEGLEHPFI
jgi:hypothetical protein